MAGLSEIIRLFRQQSQRTKTVQKNIVGNAIIKGLSIILSLLIIPLTIGYVSEYDYGIWIALSSVIGWLSYFDIGVNNGLRNKLTEAISRSDYYLAKKYVSTTYAILFLIFVPLFLLFVLLYKFINWYDVFSIDAESVHYLPELMVIIVGFVCLRSILSTVNIILLANQRTAQSGLVNFLEQLGSFGCIAILVKYTSGSLFNLCLVFCVVPLIILATASIIMFAKRYKDIRPSIKTIDWSLKAKLFNMGIKFFIIQIAGLIQFQTTSFIILKYYGASDVTAYNIAFKYFNIIYMCWGLTLSPLWNAITEAKVKNDFNWIRQCVKRYRQLFIVFLLGGVVMLSLSSVFYKIWLGDRIAPIPFSLSLVICLYVLSLTWGSLYVQILNGLGALKIQYMSSIISPILFLCLCFVLTKYLHVGVISVVISSIVANFNGIILAPIQYNIIASGKKPNSIWSTME